MSIINKDDNKLYRKCVDCKNTLYISDFYIEKATSITDSNGMYTGQVALIYCGISDYCYKCQKKNDTPLLNCDNKDY
jgi:hypothetical protein